MHWALRRAELCDPGLCPDAPDDNRCQHCPLDKLDSAQTAAAGQLLRRVIDLRAALKLGIRVGLDEIPADEWVALLIVDEEISKREEGQAHGRHSAGIGT